MSRVCSAVRAGLTVALATAAFVGAAARLPAAEPQGPAAEQPTFRSSTALVPLDVRVLDQQGKPVTNLMQADFTVTENRVPQAIRHFATQELTAAPVPVGEPAVRPRRGTASSLEPQDHRVFLIVLGRGNLQPPSKGIDGAIHLVRDRLLPQDRVAILAWNRSTEFTVDRASTLAFLDRFKKNYLSIERGISLHFSSLAYYYGNRQMPASVQKAIDETFTGSEGAAMRSSNAALTGSVEAERALTRQFDALTAPEGDAFAAVERETIGVDLDTFMQDVAQTMQDEANLYAGIEYLRHLDGEKHLVWITEFGLRRSFRDDVELDREIGRRAADARVVLNIIRTGGTQYSPGGFGGVGAAELPRPSRITGPAAMGLLLPAATSRTLASMTGGRSDANRFPNASVSADYIEQASRFQYTLGYYPTNGRLDGRFRDVKVTVNRPGLTVLVRAGYYAREEVGPLDRRAVVTYGRMSAAASDAREVADLGLRATVVSGPNAVTIRITLDVSRVTFERVGGRNTALIDIAAFCLDRRQRAVGDVRHGAELNFSDERLAVVKREGVPITFEIPVTGAPETVKLVAYAFPDDLLGSRNIPVAK